MDLGPFTTASLDNINVLLTTASVLIYYDVTRPTAVSADASNNRLGGALLQFQDKE